MDAAVTVSSFATTGTTMDLLWCASKGKHKEDKPSIPPREGRGIGEDGIFFRPSQTPQAAMNVSTTGNIPELNMDIIGMKSFSLTIPRGRSGFGFTLFGSSPVQVGRVDEESPAALADLRQNDCIVRINGMNVSRSTAESVARIVRDTHSNITLDIHRPTTRDQLYPSSCWSSSAVCSDDAIRLSTSSDIQPSERHHPIDMSRCPQPGTPISCHSVRRPLTPITNNNCLEFPKMGSKSRCLGDVDRWRESCSMEFDAKSSATTDAKVASHCLDKPLLRLRSFRRDSSVPRAVKKISAHLADGSITENAMKCGKENDVPCPKGDLRGDLRKTSLDSISQECFSTENTGDEQDRSIQKLITCLEDFVLQIQLGVSRYVKPIRQTSLPPEDQNIIFQNMESILSVSEQLLRQLHSRRIWRASQSTTDDANITDIDDDSTFSSHVSIDSMTSVFLLKMEEYCDAFETYCSGIRSAVVLLVSLRKNPGFEQFLKAASRDCDRLTISAFLQKPLEHIKDMVLLLQRILRFTDPTGSAYDQLKQIVNALRISCNRINENHRSYSTLSLASSTESVPMKSTSVSTTSSSSSQASSRSATTASIVSSIDTELLDIQGRLIFPDHIRTFHLATASHHLIYSGHLQLVDSKGRSLTPVFVVLMSDLILFTRPDPHLGSLHVLEEPIILHDIVGCDFSCYPPSDFIISVETPLTSLQTSWTPRKIVLRTPSGELKSTWKNILEQRILNSKSQREMTMANRSVDNIV